MSGGLSNPTYFNFVYYIAWKLVALNVLGSEERINFNSAFGDNLLSLVAPESRKKVQEARKAGKCWCQAVDNSVLFGAILRQPSMHALSDVHVLF